jgi:hypothetical protein
MWCFSVLSCLIFKASVDRGIPSFAALHLAQQLFRCTRRSKQTTNRRSRGVPWSAFATPLRSIFQTPLTPRAPRSTYIQAIRPDGAKSGLSHVAVMRLFRDRGHLHRDNKVAGEKIGEQVSERRRATELDGRNPSGRFTPFPIGGGSSVEPFAQIRGGPRISVDADVLGEEAREGLQTVAFEIAVGSSNVRMIRERPTPKRTGAFV